MLNSYYGNPLRSRVRDLLWGKKSMGGVGAAGRERRHYDRFNIRLPLEATFEHEGEQRVLRSRSINVSAGGALFSSPLALLPGTFIHMRIQAPAGSLGNLFSDGLHEEAPVLIRTGCEVVYFADIGEEERMYRLGVRFSGPMRIAPTETSSPAERLLEEALPDWMFEASRPGLGAE